MSIKTLLAVANNEIGYLEKKSNKDLDDKKKNAGAGNYTKYWRDLKPSYQGQPWCNAFVNWCFYKAYGLQNAKKLLCCDTFDYYTPTTSEFFKNAGQWHTEPRVGDVVYFKNATRIHHVGIVAIVKADSITTIEGNTSPQDKSENVVANGGGVWSKIYSKSNQAIAGYGRPKYATLCRNFVARLYKYVLYRTGSEAEVSWWSDRLSSGAETGASIAKAFYLGDEYTSKNIPNRGYIYDLYRGLLGRSPDDSGYQYWLSRLDRGEMTREDVLRGFVNSAEYSNVCYKCGIDRGVF